MPRNDNGERIRGIKGLPVGFEEMAGFGVITNKGSTFFGPQWEGPLELRKQRGFLGRNGLLDKVFSLLPTGKSNRQISREAGVRHELVGEIRGFLKRAAGFDPNCPCGRKANHRAECKERKRINIELSDDCIYCGGTGKKK